MTSPAISSPRTQKKSPMDFTGQKQQKLEAEKSEARTEAAKRVALVNQVEQEVKNEIIDYTGADVPLPEVEVQEVEINDPYRTIRVNTDINQMTFGRRVIDPGDMEHGIPSRMGDIPMYTFKEGQSYRVPKDMAEHLQRLGYLAYIGK
jgi:hypothetical protein